MGLAMEANQTNVVSGTCATCGGPAADPVTNKGLSCNGCWARFENDPDYAVHQDTKEARTWHKYGPRVAKPEEVEVGQGWLLEPFEGEQSTWIVKAVEDDDLGRKVVMRRWFPLGGVEEEWYARSMVEDKERGWTFLRHAYPPPAGMAAPAPAAPEDDKALLDELWEDDPGGVHYDRYKNVPRETYRVGQVWRIVETFSDVDGKRERGTLVKVIELREGVLGLTVQSKDGKKSRHGLGLCWYAKLQRRKITERPANGLVPGERWQRDFGADRWERFEVTEDGQLKMYEASAGVGGVGKTYPKSQFTWVQFKKIS